MVTYWAIFVLPALQVENDSAISANAYIFYESRYHPDKFAFLPRCHFEY